MLLLDAKSHRFGVDPIRAAIQTTGLLAIGFLVATLAVTPLRVITGWEGLFFCRRPLGLMAFFYSLAHVLIFIGYDQQWHWDQVASELLSRRYLQFGLATIVLLSPLAMTSTSTMLQRIGFGRWKKLHRLIYPAAIFAAVHFWLQSKANVRLQIGVMFVIVGLLAWRVWHHRRDRHKAMKH